MKPSRTTRIAKQPKTSKTSKNAKTTKTAKTAKTANAKAPTAKAPTKSASHARAKPSPPSSPAEKEEKVEGTTKAKAKRAAAKISRTKARPKEFQPVRLLNVDIQLGESILPVGRLAWQDRQILFEYLPVFVERGLPISPFHLPVKPGVTYGDPTIFDGLMGVFNDSLPDGWGRLLLDRKLAQLEILPGALTPIDRLAYVGENGAGALRYRPEHEREPDIVSIDLDALAEDARSVLDGGSSEVLDRLLSLGGSSGGARPKIVAACSADRTRLVTGNQALRPGFSHWLIKFRSSFDPPDVGAIEHAYSAMARAAGIDMAATHLFPARSGPGYFGTERFDRRGNARVHVHSACGLLKADFRIPSIGYLELLKATRLLTRNQLEVDRMFRRMVFNVFAKNRDDHTKNHAFILEEDGTWHSSPAFDLTFSAGSGGEHALDVAGEGRAPGLAHIEEVARQSGVHANTARTCVDEVKHAVDQWPAFASASGVSASSAATVDMQLNGRRRASRLKSK